MNSGASSSLHSHAGLPGPSDEISEDNIWSPLLSDRGTEISSVQLSPSEHLLHRSLGAGGDLPSKYIVITLWFFRQFTQTVANDQMLSSFTKYPSILSQCDQWVLCEYIQKEISHVTMGHILKVPRGFFQKVDQNVATT